MIGVLFVCTGNICRSPTAEGIFRHMVQQAGLTAAFHIDSAGTHGYHVGEAPDGRSCDTAAQHGVDLRPLRARRVTADDFERFDYLMAMDQDHLAALRRLAPAGRRERAQLFLANLHPHGNDEVPDPYYGGRDGFEQVYRLIETGSRALLDRLIDQHNLTSQKASA